MLIKILPNTRLAVGCQETLNSNVTIDGLPNELLKRIFESLPNPASVSMVCRRWLALSDLRPTEKLAFTFGCGQSRYNCGAEHASVELCQCNGSDACHVLESLLPKISARVRSLSVDDDLLHGETVSNQQLFLLITKCGTESLNELHFTGVNFSAIQPWTFILLIKCTSLREVYFDDCSFGRWAEAEFFLGRILSSSFKTLTTVSITNCPAITDKTANLISKECPELENLNLSGCENVTSTSIVSLLERAPFRKKQLLNVNLERTDFCLTLLREQINSPYSMMRGKWKFVVLNTLIGYEKPVLYGACADGYHMYINYTPSSERRPKPH
ncbi:unnamed protein product, partial [Mesorhabditis spiculigera]